MQRMLNFALVDALRAPGAFLSLAGDVKAPLKQLPETDARAEAALKFCWFISADDRSLPASEDRVPRLREAFMRASLAEYASMEVVLPEDLRAPGRPTPARKIQDSQNPLLHMVKELRNFNFHLSSTALEPGSRPAIWKAQGVDHHFDYRMWTISNLTVEAFQRLNNARFYSPADLNRMVLWFNDAQHEWGVHHLIFHAIEGYARELVQAYAPVG